MPTAAELPTRLVVISDGRADAFEGRKHAGTWTAEGDAMDADYLRELSALLFDLEWVQPRAAAGRRFHGHVTD